MGVCNLDYTEFINAVIKQDERNTFERSGDINLELPKELVPFFSQYVPVDVEIVLNDLTSVKLYPANRLKSLQNEYNLGDKYFVFATRESDPIAIMDGKIVTCAHGSKLPQIEIIASNFDAYIHELLNAMKI